MSTTLIKNIEDIYLNILCGECREGVSIQDATLCDKCEVSLNRIKQKEEHRVRRINDRKQKRKLKSLESKKSSKVLNHEEEGYRERLYRGKKSKKLKRQSNKKMRQAFKNLDMDQEKISQRGVDKKIKDIYEDIDLD